MHPVLARYLNLEAALDTLDRDGLGQPLRAEERPFAEVARTDPERRNAVLEARGKRHPPESAQAALLVLAAHAATVAVRGDVELGPLLSQAREALAAQGASPAEADRLLAALLLEEAFGYDTPPDEFDRDFFRETLALVPRLAALDRDAVLALTRAFVESAEPPWRKAHEVAADALLHAAWDEGPEPINPEHVEEALGQTLDRLGALEQARALEALRRFLAHLSSEGLLGPLRAQRLGGALAARALALEGAGGAH